MNPLKKIFLTIGFLALSSVLFAQGRSEVGIFAGMSTYSGDLQQQRINLGQSHPAIGFIFRKPVYKGLSLRLGATFGKLSGDDKDSKDSGVVQRNLNFQSSVSDFHLLAEYNFFDIDEVGFTPYIFAGIALYHFNPYARDTSGNKVYLQALGTEGQGLSIYPDRIPYKLTQVAIPFGGGVKFALSDVINLGIEMSFRKTFTDHIDDVNGTYPDHDVLLNERGQTAVDFSFRTNQLPGHNKDPFPAEGSVRGSGKYDDWYYFTGVTLTFRLNGGNGNGLFGKALRAVRCPTYK